jgi:glycosyltransferase involved in cell wall biosynthesis
MTQVEIVLPVLNEENVLERSVRTLHAALSEDLGYSWHITIADNGSTDRTPTIAHQLSRDLVNVSAFHVEEAGRGQALTKAWLASDAEVLSYMDIDLSTDLGAFPCLIDSILLDGNDIAAGTRLGVGSDTKRSLRREVLSRGFVFLINRLFGTRLRDTQCGFKAVGRDCAHRLLPFVRDRGWFWDTELLLLGAKGGWSIAFIPVRWREDTDSRVRIVRTVWRDLQGLARMRRFDWSRVRNGHIAAINDARFKFTGNQSRTN